MNPKPEPSDHRAPANGRAMLALLAALVCLSALSLTGCGDDSPDTDKAAPAETTATSTAKSGPKGKGMSEQDLDGRTFLSTSVSGHDLVADSVLRLTFEGSVLAANAGCNTMTSEYSLADGALAWSAMPAATMMGCDPDLMAQDTWITGLLTEGMKATLEEDVLTLVGDGVTIEMKEEAQTELTGTTWKLESLGQGDAVSSLPSGTKPATIEIAEGGNVTVFTGCNNGGTTVEVADQTLTFGVMRLTQMACPDDDASVEKAVVTVLDGETQMDINGTTLTITKDDQSLVFTAS